MIVVLIVAILAAIAIPSYQNYIIKSRAKTAAADLVGLSVNLENAFQKTLTYPLTSSGDYSTAAKIEAVSGLSGWAPGQSEFFGYSATGTSSSYSLTATGTGAMANCVLTLDSSNNRTATDACKLGTTATW